jgi:hypothetical protein
VTNARNYLDQLHLLAAAKALDRTAGLVFGLVSHGGM